MVLPGSTPKPVQTTLNNFNRVPTSTMVARDSGNKAQISPEQEQFAEFMRMKQQQQQQRQQAAAASLPAPPPSPAMQDEQQHLHSSSTEEEEVVIVERGDDDFQQPQQQQEQQQEMEEYERRRPVQRPTREAQIDAVFKRFPGWFDALAPTSAEFLKHYPNMTMERMLACQPCEKDGETPDDDAGIVGGPYDLWMGNEAEWNARYNKDGTCHRSKLMRCITTEDKIILKLKALLKDEPVSKEAFHDPRRNIEPKVMHERYPAMDQPWYPNKKQQPGESKEAADARYKAECADILARRMRYEDPAYFRAQKIKQESASMYYWKYAWNMEGCAPGALFHYVYPNYPEGVPLFAKGNPTDPSLNEKERAIIKNRRANIIYAKKMCQKARGPEDAKLTPMEYEEKWVKEWQRLHPGVPIFDGPRAEKRKYDGEENGDRRASA